MTSYTPDHWVIIKITSKEFGTVHKILAGWYGGYCSGESWKLSSGNLEHYKSGEFIFFPQESGSLYQCHPDAEGMSGYTRSIYEDLRKNIEAVPIATIEIVAFKDYKF